MMYCDPSCLFGGTFVGSLNNIRPAAALAQYNYNRLQIDNVLGKWKQAQTQEQEEQEHEKRS